MADPNNIQKMDVEKDLNGVMEIWRDSAKDAHKEFISIDFWDSKKVQDNFLNEVSNQKKERYVYTDEKKEIRGFIIASNNGYIFEMYVKKSFFRKKIGTVLFETLQGENPRFSELKGRYPKFTSSVYAHNYISISWHIKNKFKITGIHFCSLTGLPKFDLIWKRK